jgi:hypothetical protein
MFNAQPGAQPQPSAAQSSAGPDYAYESTFNRFLSKPGPGEYNIPEHKFTTGVGKFVVSKAKNYIEQAVYAKADIPGPCSYTLPSVASKTGGRFSTANPKSQVDWMVYEAASKPSPGQYDLPSTLVNSGGTFSTANPKSDVDVRIAAAARTPGPGQYFNGGKVSEGRVNSNMGGRCKSALDMQLDAARSTPGPGAYNIPDSKFTSGVGAFSAAVVPTVVDIACRRAAETPGPGNYDPKVIPSQSGMKMTLSRSKSALEMRIAEASQMPGPGAYELPSSVTEVSGGRFSTSFPMSDLDWKIKTAAGIPGPGEYNIPSSMNDSGGKFSNSYAKSAVEWDIYRASFLPGPGTYDIPHVLAGHSCRFSRGHPKSDVEWSIYNASQVPGPGSYNISAPKEAWDIKFPAGNAKSDVEWQVYRASTIPGPGQYNIPDSNDGGGVRFSESFAKTALEWEIYRSSSLPPPGSYDLPSTVLNGGIDNSWGGEPQRATVKRVASEWQATALKFDKILHERMEENAKMVTAGYRNLLQKTSDKKQSSGLAIKGLSEAEIELNQMPSVISNRTLRLQITDSKDRSLFKDVVERSTAAAQWISGLGDAHLIKDLAKTQGRMSALKHRANKQRRSKTPDPCAPSHHTTSAASSASSQPLNNPSPLLHQSSSCKVFGLTALEGSEQYDPNAAASKLLAAHGIDASCAKNLLESFFPAAKRVSAFNAITSNAELRAALLTITAEWNDTRESIKGSAAPRPKGTAALAPFEPPPPLLAVLKTIPQHILHDDCQNRELKKLTQPQLDALMVWKEEALKRAEAEKQAALQEWRDFLREQFGLKTQNATADFIAVNRHPKTLEHFKQDNRLAENFIRLVRNMHLLERHHLHGFMRRTAQCASKKYIEGNSLYRKAVRFDKIRSLNQTEINIEMQRRWLIIQQQVVALLSMWNGLRLQRGAKYFSRKRSKAARKIQHFYLRLWHPEQMQIINDAMCRMRSAARYWVIKRRVAKKNAARDLIVEFLRDIMNFNTVKRGVTVFIKKIRLLQRKMKANLARKHAVLNSWLQQVDAVFKDCDKLLGLEAVGKAKEKIRRLKMAIPKQLRGTMPHPDDTLDAWVSHKAKVSPLLLQRPRFALAPSCSSHCSVVLLSCSSHCSVVLLSCSSHCSVVLLLFALSIFISLVPLLTLVQWLELQKVWATRAQERKKNAELLGQQVAEWERINVKRKMVVLSLPRDARGKPNVARAPAAIRIMIRDMMQPKPFYPKVDSSLLADDKVRRCCLRSRCFALSCT